MTLCDISSVPKNIHDDIKIIFIQRIEFLFGLREVSKLARRNSNRHK